MFEFDLQRFDEEVADAEPQAQAEEKEIPEELGGLPEEIARETLAEWEKSQPQPEEEPPAEEKTQTQESVPYARFKEKVDEANKLKAQLAEYQKQAPQQQQPQPQFQPPQFRITPEVSARINEAIQVEALSLSGLSQDDVKSLEYADEDDPRISQWQQARNIAQNRVYSAIQQAQLDQQQQARQFYDNHISATNTYNEFVAKEFSEPDFKEVQSFAVNEFFNQLNPNEQKIIANSYLRIERQTASPAEMMVVKNYYERAKAAYRTRDAKKNPPAKSAPTLPRSDQLRGSSGTKDGLSASDIEKLLEGDFTKLDQKQQNFLLGIS